MVEYKFTVCKFAKLYILKKRIYLINFKVKFRNFEHDTFISIRYEDDELTGN